MRNVAIYMIHGPTIHALMTDAEARHLFRQWPTPDTRAIGMDLESGMRLRLDPESITAIVDESLESLRKRAQLLAEMAEQP